MIKYLITIVLTIALCCACDGEDFSADPTLMQHRPRKQHAGERNQAGERSGNPRRNNGNTFKPEHIGQKGHENSVIADAKSRGKRHGRKIIFSGLIHGAGQQAEEGVQGNQRGSA